MNKKAQVVFVLSLLTLFVIVALLNIKQNVLYNDSSVAIFLNKGYVNETDAFADKSSSHKPYSTIKPYKSSSNYSNNAPSDLNVPLNTQRRIKVRNSGRKSLETSNSVSPSSMGLSYNQSDKLNNSNESVSMGIGSLGSSKRGSNNATEGYSASNGGLLASQTTLVGQTSSSLLVPYNNGNGNTILIDPSTDPIEEERIPVGDGVWLLSLFALFYAVWKSFVSSSK